jgi:hypothetical protein
MKEQAPISRLSRELAVSALVPSVRGIDTDHGEAAPSTLAAAAPTTTTA